LIRQCLNQTLGPATLWNGARNKVGYDDEVGFGEDIHAAARESTLA